MHIYVWTQVGKRITIFVEPSDVIEVIKAKIYDEEGVPRGRQVLKFNGTQLEDGSRIDEFGIQHESELNLEARPDPFI
jgi:hypothetical protein